jgi:endonuclease/exonuclease/phosphatase family metal-dependent hydrolase
MTFRIMTFNIRGAVPDRDGPNAWEHRASLTLSLIERTTPDLIGFQELMHRNLKAYQKWLRTYQWVLGPPTMEETRLNYNAIFWNLSRLDLLESGGFWLSPTPEQWSRGWESRYVRAATWARFRWRHTGQAFCHLNVHLDAESAQARLQSCPLLLRQLAALHLDRLPVLLTGDFNCHANGLSAPSDEETTLMHASYRFLLDHGFVDTYLAAGHLDAPPGGTYHGFEGVHYEPAWRVDWILTRNGASSFTVHACDILQDAAPPLYPSDHYPVLAELALTGDAGS